MKESLGDSKRILTVDDERDVLTAPEKEIQGVFPNSQLDVAAFYESVVDMKEWL